MTKKLLQKIKLDLPGIKENESLAPYTTFKIGGPAKYFFIAQSEADLIRAINAAMKSKIKYYVLGGGSNILVSDVGFDGLVVKCQMSNVKCQNDQIIADAGALLSLVVGKSIEAKLTGLEWAAGIYGTIGGAIRGNAGAFGHSMSKITKEVKAARIIKDKFKITNLKNKQCQFGYRDSIFKKNKDIILEATFKLVKGDREKSEEMIASFLRQRKNKQPFEYPSAGSIFKNYKIANLNELKPNLRELLPEELKEQKIIPAGWLIDKLELKGKKIGGAMISEKHANFIVNVGGATASDVLQLISFVKMRARDTLRIQLEEEIEYLE
jgi:UDP-N-acetylmuramate dehydrogenase